ncbi:MAG: exosortase C-terminal domain/associated protein EpsI [Candidatus Omnitrophota bacterium]
MKNTLGFIIVIVMLIVSALFSLNLFFQQRNAHDTLDVRQFPYAIGQWQGKDLPVSEKEYDILETRNLIVREYTNPQGEKISLFIIYSETNRCVFHPPEVCFIGSGVKIADKDRTEIPRAQGKICVNKMSAEKNDRKDLVLYCYKAGKLYTENFYLQQTVFALHQLLGKRISGASIRVAMEVKEEEATLPVLKAFLTQSVQAMDSFR